MHQKLVVQTSTLTPNMHQKLTKCGIISFVGKKQPTYNQNQRPLHTRDREPVSMTLQALSLVEKVELVEVPFTLRSKDQRSM